ncbi:DUF2478 domain-containing protein [Granulosicoccus sp. 3-233]|uniref:DUF2478 domain-containing protein n=1 Tax=Granulosicoccus sp. 3-233 TaxID=3417969 RepID=UPI003D3279D4
MNTQITDMNINGFALAGVPAAEAGQVDRLLSALAVQLSERGIRLAGAVQSDVERHDRSRCDMTLRILGSNNQYSISADLGPLSKGCRLDTGALEMAAWEVENLLRTSSDEALAQLLIVNKFSKSEAQGKGFASVIALAMERGVPVLCGIGQLSSADFRDFTDEQAELLEASEQAIEQWVNSRVLAS